MGKLFLWMELLRVRHYVKNVLIAIPLMFSGKLFDSINPLLLLLESVLVFCWVSSSIYIINDIVDRSKDANHPRKCKRPIACGKVRVPEAIVLAAIFTSMGVVGAVHLSYISSWYVLVMIMVYYALNLAYSLKLKHVPVVEVVILASGFLIRVLYGGCSTGVEVSSWLYLTVLSISFYLGLGKRRNELERCSECDTRDVLKFYNQRFLDRNMYMFLSLSICFYSLWSIEQGRWALISVPLVMFACMRYSLIVEGASEGDPVDVILKDKILMFTIAVYGLYLFISLYML